MEHSKGMTAEDIYNMMEKTNSNELIFDGDCYDCNKTTTVRIFISDYDTGEFKVEGGGIWYKEEDFRDTHVTTFTLKCDECMNKDPVLHDQECEVFSRVCGYLRPVHLFNKGKQEEFKQRICYEIPKEESTDEN